MKSNAGVKMQPWWQKGHKAHVYLDVDKVESVIHSSRCSCQKLQKLNRQQNTSPFPSEKKPQIYFKTPQATQIDTQFVITEGMADPVLF